MAVPPSMPAKQPAKQSSHARKKTPPETKSTTIMAVASLILAVLGATAYVQASPRPPLAPTAARSHPLAQLPAQAQRINQKAFNVLPNVLPLTESNATTFFLPPGSDPQSLRAKPFHVYDDDFLAVIGQDPKLSLIAHEASGNPIFHEAVVWYPPTDEMFFVQNAGARAAGTGLNKSSLIYKISLAQAGAVIDKVNASGLVDVVEVTSSPIVVNPNG